MIAAAVAWTWLGWWRGEERLVVISVYGASVGGTCTFVGVVLREIEVCYVWCVLLALVGQAFFYLSISLR